MEANEKTINYEDGDLTVHWKPKVCIHSEVCVKGLPNVFKPKDKPWIDLSGAENDAIAHRIDKCPSGALAYSWKGKQEKSEDSVSLSAQLIGNGTILINGELSITYPDGKADAKKNPALCRCGASSNKPFCDGSHSKIDFKG